MRCEAFAVADDVDSGRSPRRLDRLPLRADPSVHYFRLEEEWTIISDQDV